ncbi:MAG: DUF1772 domain-containing protein [Bacteroidetes bacterium]|nr:DUF1772 domain-containing protein [Bacteroidota bacterium]
MNSSGIFRILNLVLVGVLAGTMLEEYFIVKIVFSSLATPQWGELHAKFGVFHLPVIIPIAALATVSLVILLISERKLKTLSLKFTWIAVPFFLAIIIITAVFMMPLNFIISEWQANGIPADAEYIKIKWLWLHGARTIFSIIGFIILTIALFYKKPALPNNKTNNIYSEKI